jgi:hypothetical protein
LRTWLLGRSAYGQHTSRSTWRAALRGNCCCCCCSSSHSKIASMLHCMRAPPPPPLESCHPSRHASLTCKCAGLSCCAGLRRFVCASWRRLLPNKLLLKASTLVSSAQSGTCRHMQP